MREYTTQMGTLALHLSSFAPIVIDGNAEMNAQTIIMKAEFSDTKRTEFAKDCLYIVTISREEDCEILQYEATFLIVNKMGVPIEKRKMARINAIVISPESDDAEIFYSVNEYYKAIQEYTGFSWCVLGGLADEWRLKEHLELLASRLGNPVAILDSAFNQIAESTDEKTGDTVWDLTTSNSAEKFSKEARKWMYEDLPDIVNGLNYPIIFHRSPMKRRIIARIPIDNSCNYTLEILEHGKRFEQKDLAFIHFHTGFLQYYISEHYHDLKKDTLSSLLEGIISGKQEEWRIPEKAKKVGLQIAKKNFLAVVFPENRDVPYDQILQVFRKLSDGVKGTSVLLGNEIIMIIDGRKYEEQIKPFLTDYFAKQVSFRCGLSEEFASVSTIKRAYDQCKAAVKWGDSRQFRAKIHEYKNYRTYHFFNKAATEDDIAFFCVPEAKEMLSYDQANQTEFAYTVYAYLRNFKNVSATAAELNVHRNTILYRVEKAAQIFGLKMEDVAEMNNLLFSFEMLASKNPEFFFGLK